ncbi:MAG TPA: ribosome maturation factor RimM [Dictyoglomaceae bacterium]|nr:ribosome maturation factor RimM [Dictyoglomaceae bacterium]HOL39175.1 ribosome maturation factor RimM [Dictyoglomaceae bacterium]HPP15329.1 ribosome maturation factor RimM [Dictyoglomaceae bacterium]HPU44039.1 ribosome maturation factor RimM [Dictyoglomaceae bacterium]
MPSRLIRIAKIGEPFGIRGGIKIWSFFDPILNLKKGQMLYLSCGDTLLVKEELALELVREHNKGFVVYFSGIDTREKAEKIKGNWLLLDESELPELPEWQFYSFQIIGLPVYEISGEYLGTIREIIETGSNDVYVIENEEEELYIPAIKDIIMEVDLKENKMIVRLMEEY